MNLLIIQSLNVLYVFTLIILIKFRYLFCLIIFQKTVKQRSVMELIWSELQIFWLSKVLIIYILTKYN